MSFLSRVETPTCGICGYRGELNVPNEGIARRNSGALIQDAFPDLDVAEREQLVSGTHPDCWKKMVGGI
jgi:hypothetical protein